MEHIQTWHLRDPGTIKFLLQSNC